MRFQRTLVGTTMIAAAWPVAGAQAVDYGGGTPADSLRRAHRQVTLVGIRTAANGRARIWVRVPVRCGNTGLVTNVRPNANGDFAIRATTRRRLPDGVRRTGRFRITGRISGSAASGTASMRLTYRRGGRVTDRCGSGRRTWQARVGAAQSTPAPPRANGTYYGFTAQGKGRPFAFVLNVGASARRVQTTVFEYRQRCGRGVFEWDNVTPGVRIGADGTFHQRERFSQRWAEGTERYRVAIDGRFTTSGVVGTLRVTSVLRSRRNGRVIDRCDTGAATFAAAP
jgi:hypothetical protein